MEDKLKVGETYIHKNLSRSIYEVKKVTEKQYLMNRSDEDGTSTLILADIDDKGFVNNLIPTGVPIERGILNMRMKKVNENIKSMRTKIARYNEALEIEISTKNGIQRELDILDQSK